MRRVEIDTRRLVEAFAPDGLHGVGMVEIARVAGVAKPTLYRSHASKDELFLVCVEAEVERLLERLYGAWARATQAVTSPARVHDGPDDPARGGVDRVAGASVTAAARSHVPGVLAEPLVGDGGGGPPATRAEPLAEAIAALVRELLAYADEQPAAFRLLFVTAAHRSSTVADDVAGTLDRIVDRLAELLARHPAWHADPADAELVAGLLPAAAVNAVTRRAAAPDRDGAPARDRAGAHAADRDALAARIAALLVPPPVGTRV